MYIRCAPLLLPGGPLNERKIRIGERKRPKWRRMASERRAATQKQDQQALEANRILALNEQILRRLE